MTAGLSLVSLCSLPVSPSVSIGLYHIRARQGGDYDGQLVSCFIV